VSEYTEESSNNNVSFKNFHYYDKILTIVRSPLEAALSFYHFRLAKSHTGRVATYSREHFASSIATHLDVWFRHFNAVIKAWERGQPVLMIHYEDMKENLKKEIAKVRSFLCVKPSRVRLTCVLVFPEGKFRRKR